MSKKKTSKPKKQKQKRAKKEREKNNSKFLIKLMVIIASLLFLIVIVKMATEYLATVVKKDMVYSGKMVDSINISGLILYDYDQYYIEGGSYLIRTINEGDRARVGSVIGAGVNTNNPLYEQVKKVSQDINSANKLLEINTGIASQDQITINKLLEKEMLDLPLAISQKKINEIEEHKEKIQDYLEYKKALVAGQNYKKDLLDDLFTQFNGLKMAMASDYRPVYCASPGYVTYSGYENLSYEEVSNILPEDLNLRLEAQKEENNPYLIKVSKSNNFYIAAVLASSDAARIKDLSQVIIHINTGGIDLRIDVKDIKIGNSSGNETVVFFMTDNGLSKLASIGAFDGLLEIGKYEGLKVPVNSIYNFKYSAFQRPQMAIIKGITVKFVELEILYSDDLYAIVKSKDPNYSFKVYDYYVLDPYKVKDGDVVN